MLMNSAEKYVEIISNKEYSKILIKDIVYIHSDGRTIEFVCYDKNKKKNYCIFTYGKIDKYMYLLEESQFVRVRKTVIVNLKFMDNYNVERIIVQNKEFSIPKTLRKEVRNKYLIYSKRNSIL